MSCTNHLSSVIFAVFIGFLATLIPFYKSNGEYFTPHNTHCIVDQSRMDTIRPNMVFRFL